MESVEGVPEEECIEYLLDRGGRPRKIKTILYYKGPRATASSAAIATKGNPVTPEGEKWSLGSLDVKTAFLYAELNEEEDGIIVVQPPAVLVRLGLVRPGVFWKLKKA
eukprot:6596970-Lingulodinium_polyedra.AAC.1